MCWISRHSSRTWIFGAPLKSRTAIQVKPVLALLVEIFVVFAMIQNLKILFLFCCVGGVSGTPPALLDLRFNYATLSLSWFAWYSASRRCLCRAGKAINLALLCGMDVYVSKVISLNTKIWLRKCAVFRKAHSHVHLGCFLLRWSLNSYIFLISQRI